MNTVQSIVFPNLHVQAPEDMYLRPNDRAWCDLRAECVHFERGGLVYTDTFYNGLSVNVWKRHCDLQTLFLRLRGVGRFVITIGCHRLDRAPHWIAEHRLTLSNDEDACLAVPEWAGLQARMLFLRVRALDRAMLCGAAFETADAVRNPVRLGMVITHFNRPAQALPAIKRLQRTLLDHAEWGERLSLTVVDNSSNLAVPPHPRTLHIPNRNLGGTGGFVRGLLSLIDGAAHTHALFMDDDTSCEPASIARTLALLMHCRDPRLSVAGALLREGAPWELAEKGACFDGQVRQLHAGLDMRRVGDLLAAEEEIRRPDYGAWWFFAFPIAEVRAFPFPFFVRGDDIFFGLRNRFRITTLNGVACFGQDFGSKHSPMTAYLDTRYHLVHALLAPRGRASRILQVGSRLFVKSLSCYLYSSARAVTLAMRHTLQGPAFFRDNLDMREVRAEIGSWQPAEKLLPLDPPAQQLHPPRRHHESPLRRLLRTVSLQGFLLPSSLIRDRMTVQPKHFHGRASGVFRYRRVLYRHAETGTGFIAEFDRPRFFRELGNFLATWARLCWHLPAVRKQYAEGADAMATEAFWRTVYGDLLVPVSSAAPVTLSSLAPIARPLPDATVAADVEVAPLP